MEADIQLSGSYIEDQTKISFVLEHIIDAMPLARFPEKVLQQKQVSALKDYQSIIMKMQETKTVDEFEHIHKSIIEDESMHQFTKELLLCRCEYYRTMRHKYNNPHQQGFRGGPKKR